MKTKLFLVLIAVTLIFQACSSDDVNDPITEISQYAGTWSGTYNGDDNGTWTITFSADGLFVSGSGYSNVADVTFKTTSATVTADGGITSRAENGTVGTAQVNGDTVNGTWVNGDVSGSMTGQRE